jgi:spore coat polysaccharide biosynthesis predicted glycosyltransferase SpsG
VLVLDSYRASEGLLAHAAATGPLVAMHDHGDPPDEAALVVSVAGKGLDEGPERLIGPAYAALRPCYWGLPVREQSSNVERLLVTTGSGQLDALGCELAHALLRAVPSLEVSLVRGPDAHRPAPEGVSTLAAPESLLKALLHADLVITAGGQTMLEAAACGVPCVALALVDNQRAQVALLAGKGALRSIDAANEAVAVVGELMADRATRQRLASVGQATVDGYGAFRIAFAIDKLTEQA